jgi:predicted nucleotidyltransferase
MSEETLLRAIRRAMASSARVQAALLFGSRATERARADSDIDVAVLLDEAPSASDRKNVLMSLASALGKELRADRLDIVLLNDAPPKLAFQVLRHGVVAFQRDPVPLHRFRVATYSRHADYEPVERLFRAVTKRRALSEAGHG